MRKFEVRHKESKTVIDSFTVFAAAVRAMGDYETCDRLAGIYKPGFYEVYDCFMMEVIA